MKERCPRQMRLSGSVHRVKKATGLRALYLHYCYLLGYLPRDRPHRPLSPEMREAVRRMDRYSAQAKLLVRHKLDSIPAVENFIRRTDREIHTVSVRRDKLYNRMRRCQDPAELEQLKTRRDDCTAQLKALGKERKTAQGVLDSQEEIQDKLRAELAMWRELYRPEKTKERKRGHVKEI